MCAQIVLQTEAKSASRQSLDVSRVNVIRVDVEPSSGSSGSRANGDVGLEL